MRRAIPALLLAVLLLAACGDDGEVAVDDLGDEVEPTEDVDDGEDDAAGEPEAEEPEEPEEAGEDDGAEAQDEHDPGPQPDPAMVAEPCAEREGQEFDPFLDVVSPVDGQQVLDSVELIGCANVPEGTVRYRVLADDGEALVDDFTTAECGGPCVGTYDTVIDLAGVGDEHDTVTLEVFWDSPADGTEEDRSELQLHLE